MSINITDDVFCGGPAGSNNSSQYFGSVDSSQTSQKANGQSNDSEARAMEVVSSEHFNKYVPHRVCTPSDRTLSLALWFCRPTRIWLERGNCPLGIKWRRGY